jgi:hypothetical protein
MNNVEKLERMEKALLEDSPKQQTTYRKLGHLKADLGFPSSGLADVLQAYALHAGIKVSGATGTLSVDELRRQLRAQIDEPKPGTPFELAAQIGEGLRLYARDVDFSADANRTQPSVETLEQSLRWFDYAIKQCSTDRVDQQAWILAHRAAAFATCFWFRDALGGRIPKDAFAKLDRNDLFICAKQGFDAALRLQPGYAWCRRFLAFLLTLEGSDFEKAEAHLDRARADGASNDSSLERSRAILFLNMTTKAPPAEQRQRARQSLDSATEAMRLDPEEFVAGYFAAASLTILIDADEKRSGLGFERKQNDAFAAIESARVRSKNAISQAYATLIGLNVLEAHLRKTCRGASSEDAEAVYLECEAYMQMAQKAHVDLETRVVFDREIRRLQELEGLSPELKKRLSGFLNQTYRAAPQN